MLEALIVVLVIVWLFGWIGPSYWPVVPNAGGFVHVLLIVVVVLLLLRVFGGGGFRF